MRRLVVEIRLKDIAGMNGRETSMLTAIQKIKSFKILNFLKQSREESAFICRLVFKDPSSKIKDLPFFRLMKLQVLEQEKEKGTYTVFVKSKAQPQPRSKSPRTTSEVYLTSLTISDEAAQATFLGNSKPIRSILLRFDKSGIHYRIVSLTDARFSADSPLSRLTDRQLEILRTAHSLGYYDLPRKINSDQLASKLGLVNSTFVAHRRKAERKILSEIFSSK